MIHWQYPQEPAPLVVRVARNLLAFACDAGAPALASFLLPTASMGCTSAAALVHALESGDGRGRSSLLHRALRSNCSAMVEGLLSWGAQTGYKWQVAHWTPMPPLDDHGSKCIVKGD